MAIPEAQLETWSHQGSITQSAATYETVRNVLNDPLSPYYRKSFTIFLQGSYGNDTNVVGRDSDVDIVIRLNDTYYADTDALGPGAKANYDRGFSAAPYGFTEFRRDVLTWLTSKYGVAVTSGNKAISIKGAGARRDADVLVCTKSRLYRADSDGTDTRYHEGITFFRTDNGKRIDNFPKQHADNCTTKHQGTNNCFKPSVRIFKNLRNRMVDERVIRSGLAPSYFVEGLLSNVPSFNFSTRRQDTFVNAFKWAQGADKTKLLCANGIHWLVRTGLEVCWPDADFDAYLAATARYWDNWGK